MRLVFWQPNLSFHQSSTIRALTEMGCTVKLVAEHGLSPHRRSMGWAEPDFGKAEVIITPDERTIREIIYGATKDIVHIMAGFRAYPTVKRALKHAIDSNARVGVMAEAADPRGFGGMIRRILYTGQRKTSGRHVDFILAMGQLGVRWYRRCGYSEARIFPYAYVTEQPAADDGNEIRPALTDQVEIVYLGACIPRKAVDRLLMGLAPLSGMDWRLSIIGDGPSQARLQKLAAELGIMNRVHFRGVMQNQQALRQLATGDFLVLPSWHDGWGAVVNESLMSGVPVICSDRCGASDLLRNPWIGEVFTGGRLADLTSVLRKWIEKGKKSAEQAARIRAWSRCITGQAVAAYLLAILDHCITGASRPQPPWYPSERR